MLGFRDGLPGAFVLLLGGTIFICATAILPPLWDAIQRIAQSDPPDSLHQCMHLPHGPQRLDCLEAVLRRPPPQPAKGANIPGDLFKN